MKRIMRFVVPVVGSLLLLTSIPLTVHASLIDQFNFPAAVQDDTVGHHLLGRYNVGAQTFTVGMTGILTSVDIPIGTFLYTDSDGIDWQIRSTNNGVLDSFLNTSTILASGTIIGWPQSNYFMPIYDGQVSLGFHSIDLSSYNIFVANNDQLAILIGGFAPWEDYDSWFGTSIDQYNGGTAYQNSLQASSVIFDSNGHAISYGPLIESPWQTVVSASWEINDFYFATHVEPIPEPGTMMLLGSGLLGLVGYGRRRFKK